MEKIAVVTDSNSGIIQSLKPLKLFVIPMPFYINGETYYEGVNITKDELYKKMGEDADISTSLPAMGSVIELWDRLLEDYEQIVHIPMSSGLSASCEAAEVLSREYNGRVFVVNNQRISVTQRQSVLDAVALAKEGWTGDRIKERLESVKLDSSIYIMVDTLKHLKKSGRITPAAAAIGTVLNIKPVLQIQGEKLDSYAKARGVKQARKIMVDAMKNDFNTRFSDFSTPEGMWLHIAYAGDEKEGLFFKEEVEREFPGFQINVETLSLGVTCHIGQGALALACSRKVSPV